MNNIKVNKPNRLFGFEMNPKPITNYPRPRAPVSPVKFAPTKTSISPVKLSIYPSRTPREVRLIDKKPFGDYDKDGVPNYFDCKPMDKKRQEFLSRIKPVKGAKKKYRPQVINTAAKLMQEDNVREQQKQELEKFAKNPATYERKIKQLEKESQPERVGLFDFIAIPGVVETLSQGKHKPTYFRHPDPMDLIIEDGVVKGNLVTKRRGEDVQEIKSLYIRPEYRKQGIGKRVVSTAFKNPKIKRVVGVAAAKSKGYWEKLGGFAGDSKEEQEALEDYRKSFMADIQTTVMKHAMETGELPERMPDKFENLSPEFQNYLNELGTSFEITKEEFEKRFPEEAKATRRGWGKKAMARVPPMNLPKDEKNYSEKKDYNIYERGERKGIKKTPYKQDLRTKPDEITKQAELESLDTKETDIDAVRKRRTPEEIAEDQYWEKYGKKREKLEKQLDKELGLDKEKKNKNKKSGAKPKKIEPEPIPIANPEDDPDDMYKDLAKKALGEDFIPTKTTEEPVSEEKQRQRDYIASLTGRKNKWDKRGEFPRRKEVDWKEFKEEFVEKNPKGELPKTLSFRKTPGGEIIETRKAIMAPGDIKSKVYKYEENIGLTYTDKSPVPVIEKAKYSEGARKTLMTITKESKKPMRQQKRRETLSKVKRFFGVDALTKIEKETDIEMNREWGKIEKELDKISAFPEKYKEKAEEVINRKIGKWQRKYMPPEFETGYEDLDKNIPSTTLPKQETELEVEVVRLAKGDTPEDYFKRKEIEAEKEGKEIEDRLKRGDLDLPRKEKYMDIYNAQDFIDIPKKELKEQKIKETKIDKEMKETYGEPEPTPKEDYSAEKSAQELIDEA